MVDNQRSPNGKSKLNNWKTKTTTERGGRRGRKKTYTTQIIDYNFVTEDNRLFSGRDIVDTWKDKPVSYSEYLRSDPTTSRFAISDRNSSGYNLSVLSMIIAVVLFAIPCINALPKIHRLLTYGSVLAIVGLTPIAMGVAAPYFIFSQSAAQDNPPNDLDLVIWLIIGCSSLAFSDPFVRHSTAENWVLRELLWVKRHGPPPGFTPVGP